MDASKHTDQSMYASDHPDQSTNKPLNIPPGYTACQMPDGHDYLIPNFLLLATRLEQETEKIQRTLNIEEAPGGVCAPSNFPDSNTDVQFA